VAATYQQLIKRAFGKDGEDRVLSKSIKLLSTGILASQTGILKLAD
jgi:hypothetical protein